MQRTETTYAWVVKTNDAAEINQLHQLGRDELQIGIEHTKNALGYFAKCGDLLIKKKDEIAHGEWIPWVKLNCDFSLRTAECYMKLASNSQLAANFDEATTLEQALLLFRSPKEIIEKILSYWNDDEDIMASLAGIRVLKKTIVRLNNPTVDPDGAKRFRKSFKNTLSNMANSIKD